MLVFPGNPTFTEYYNYKIHEFLASEFYDQLPEQLRAYPDLSIIKKISNHEDTKEALYALFGDSHFLREDPAKCLKIALDLYNWSGDWAGHHLSQLHLYALYQFLSYMSDYLNDDQIIWQIYQTGDEEDVAIERAWQRYEKGSIEDINSKNALRKYLQDLSNMIGDCFEDIDFITFPEIISDAIAQNKDIPIDLVEDFADLVPQDILAHYRKIHREALGLFDNVNEILVEIAHNIKYSTEYKLLWENNKPKREVGVHDYLEAIFRICFRKGEVQIDREVQAGIGKVDFRLMKSPVEKVLIEVKLASNKKLRTGLTKQLIHYMDAERCSRAYYLIFCFTDAEYEQGRKFIEEFKAIPSKEVVVRIFDARQKTAASRLS